MNLDLAPCLRWTRLAIDRSRVPGYIGVYAKSVFEIPIPPTQMNLLPLSARHHGLAAASRWTAKAAASTTASSNASCGPEIRVCLSARPEPQAKAGISPRMTFNNHNRPHSALGGTPPAVFYRRVIEQIQPEQQVQKVAQLTPETVQTMGSSTVSFLRPCSLRRPWFRPQESTDYVVATTLMLVSAARPPRVAIRI